MATDLSKQPPTTYENQVKVNKDFWGIDNQPEGFLQELIGENRPPSLQGKVGKVYDITGFNSRGVVALLSHIVNAGHETWAIDKAFYFLITSNNAEEVFRLQANPKTSQPGNGTFFYRSRKDGEFSSKRYDELCGAVKAFYNDTDTTQFARDIKQLFQDNGNIHAVPPATAEAYILLLFEIARRLVRPKINDSPRELNKLPIGSAIARAVHLLHLKNISFEQFFINDLHCFSGPLDQRERAIEKINILFCRAELQATFVKRTNEDDKSRKHRIPKEEPVTKRLMDAGFNEPYMVIGQFLLLNRADFCQWLTDTGTAKNPERQEEFFNCLMSWWQRDIPPLNKPMSTKLSTFVNQKMGEKPVTKLAGIGTANGGRLKAAGIKKAYQVLGEFLVKNEQEFKQWLKHTCKAFPNHQNDCFNCLKYWWQRDIPPLNNPMSTKHSTFVNQTMGEKTVTELAGIGAANGERLKAAGIKKASQVLGVFLVMKKNEQEFKQWLKDTCKAFRNHQNDCFNCLNEWCVNFL